VKSLRGYLEVRNCGLAKPFNMYVETGEIWIKEVF